MKDNCDRLVSRDPRGFVSGAFGRLVSLLFPVLLFSFLFSHSLFLSACAPADPSAGTSPRPNPTPSSANSGSSRSGPAFFCEKPIYDLGRVWVGEPFDIRFRIRNVGDEDLEIRGVDSTCGCVLARVATRKIAPGEMGRLPFMITTRNLGFKDFDKTVTVRTNDPENQEIELKVVGRVLDKIELDPRIGASFGRVAPGELATREVRIVNNLDEPIDLKLRPGIGREKFRRKLETVEEGREYRLTVEFTAPDAGGVFREDIRFETGVEDPAKLLVHSSAMVPQRLDVVPVTIVLPLPSDEGFEKSVRVVNYLDTPVKVVKATTPDPRIGISVEQAPGSLEARVVLSFPAGFELEERIKLAIETDDEVVPLLEVPIRPRPQLGRRSRRGGSEGTGS